MTNRFNRRKFHGIAAAAMLAACCAAPSWAQTYPDKPIRIIVGGPAGGGLDVNARVLADRLSPLLGQPVIVDNKPGAAGLIGLQELLKSPRDGYTVMVSLNGLVSEVPHFIKMPVDPIKVLQPLNEMARGGLVLVTNAQTGAQDLNSFIAYVKANKGKVSYASYSPGTVSHTLGLEFNKLAGLDMQHVGYKGSPPALQDLIGGSVQAMFDVGGNVQAFAKAGRLKVLATTAPQRLSMFPDVPTFAEMGYKDMTESISIVLYTTPDVPAPVQAKLREAVAKALQEPKVREAIAAFGMSPGSAATSAEMLASMRTASDKQAATLKAIGFKVE